MKQLRLILPITLFILSGVLAWIIGEFETSIVFSFWLGINLGMLIIATFVSIAWALGVFDN